MARTTGVVLTRSERIPPRPTGRTAFAVAGLVALAHLGLLASAAFGRPVVFAVLAVACTALEPVAERVVPLLPWALTRTLLTLPWRWAVTLAALLCLMVVRPLPDTVLAGTVLVAGVVLALSAALVEGFADLVEHLRKSPVLTRNLPVPGLSLPAYPRWLLRLRARALTPSHLLLVVPPALAVAGLPRGLATTSLAVSVLLAVAVALAAARVVLATRRNNPRATVPPAVQAEVTRLAPDLVLYYGGGPDALYQVEMWLPVLEQSRHRTLVVLRDRESLRLMGETRLPVLCAPAGTVLMSFDLSTVRGALFVANAATNIHLLRKRGMTTAFIGHGDSDKQASSNPFVKVYDELWVAGPAGAERYEGPDTVAVTGRLVEVGRPQAGTSGPRNRSGEPATVLYAPTWEGWGDEPYHSSLPFEGVELVRRLLATPGLRLLYRPHPLTGTRSGTVRRAHGQILQLLREAGAPGADAVPVPADRRGRRRGSGRPGPDGGPFGAGAGRLVRRARPAAGGGGLLVLHGTGGAPGGRGRVAGPGQLLRAHRPADRRRLQRRLRLGRPRPPLRAGRRRGPGPGGVRPALPQQPRRAAAGPGRRRPRRPRRGPPAGKRP